MTDREPEDVNGLGIVAGVGLVILLLVIGLLFTSRPAKAENGIASHYGRGDGFHGRRTANGERFDMNAATCAHKTYRFGTMLRVTNTRTGRSTTCRVNDRGPFVRGRIVDLSWAGAQAIGMGGTAPVTVEVASQPACAILPRGSKQWRTCAELHRGF